MHQPTENHPHVHGFALESSPGVNPGLLSTHVGMDALARLLLKTQSSLLLLRRCNALLWAAQLVSGHICEGIHSKQGCPLATTYRPLPTSRLLAEAVAHSTRDFALRVFANATGRPLLFLNYEELQAEDGAALAQGKLSSFLGVDLPISLLVPRSLSFLAGLPLREELQALVESDPRISHLHDSSCGGRLSACDGTVALAINCSLISAVDILTASTVSAPPLLVMGVHSEVGGAAMLAKVMTEACKSWLTPRFGIRCSFRDNFDVCDPSEADFCFHGRARIGVGRFFDRGYRFVHFTRDPLEVITRSYQDAESDAIHTSNSSAIVHGLEVQIRRLLTEELYEMQAMTEGHNADRHYLRVRLEDLTELEGSAGEVSLEHLFMFLLEPYLGAASVRAAVLSLPSSIRTIFAAAKKLEEVGHHDRKKLAKLLGARQKKCAHLGRLQDALGYQALECLPFSEESTAQLE